MTIILKVPSIACEGCADTISRAIADSQPAAKVSVDVPAKTVTVETDSPRDEIERAIVATGHRVEA
jgi:copper chaperone